MSDELHEKEDFIVAKPDYVFTDSNELVEIDDGEWH